MKHKSTFLVGFTILMLSAGSVTLYTQIQSERVEGAASIKQVFDSILDRYVAEVDPEKLADAAIDGMLHELDPYSQHINDNNSYRLDAITTGEYGGVGIYLGQMNDSLLVISPMDGTPAFLQGILAGDRIVKIDSVWTRNLDMDEAARMVRGEQGSALKLLIKRVGEPELIEFELVREIIKIPDVSYSGILSNKTGYVKLANFSKYSAEDLEKAIRKLNQINLEALIIDLRGNPGGLLSSALMSADLFVPKGELLLETRGRINRSNKKYFSRRPAIVDPELPIAVLINGGSASASEILAGILQDYDRAVLVGEASFGKGLVQTVTRLSPESRLKLTSAKYYLPSGRLIQKREIAKDVMYEDLLISPDSGFFSENNREFEGGGGVVPDIAAEVLPVNDLERTLLRKRLFYKYALHYGAEHPGLTLPIHFNDSEVDSFYTWMSQVHSVPETKFGRWINELDQVVDSTSTIYPDVLTLKQSLVDLEIDYKLEAFHNIKPQILAGLEREMANVIGGNGARIAASLNHDRVVLRAISVLSSRSQVQEILAGPAE